MLIEYHHGWFFDEGSFIDYALLTGWPSASYWLIPGTWQED
jgi:hypothetical protein